MSIGTAKEALQPFKFDVDRISIWSPPKEGNLDKEEEPTLISKARKFSWKLVTSHLGLFIILIAYSFTGAAIMHAIESEEAQKSVPNPELIDFKPGLVNDTLREWNISAVTSEKLYQLFEKYELSKEGYEDKVVREYNYWHWLLFCITVYTTIGYGVIAPASNTGRIATMTYATIGIPLFLITMGKVGKLFTHLVKFFWSYVRQFYYLRQIRRIRKSRFVQIVTCSWMKSNDNEDSEPSSKENNPIAEDNTDNISFTPYKIDDEFDLHPLVAIIITLVYILIGSFMYAQWEKDWDYHEAFYFVFISVSTIGFGDLHPHHTKFFLLSFIYILIGLALVAMMIHVLVDFFTETAHILIGDEDEDELKPGRVRRHSVI